MRLRNHCVFCGNDDVTAENIAMFPMDGVHAPYLSLQCQVIVYHARACAGHKEGRLDQRTWSALPRATVKAYEKRMGLVGGALAELHQHEGLTRA